MIVLWEAVHAERGEAHLSKVWIAAQRVGRNRGSWLRGKVDVGSACPAHVQLDWQVLVELLLIHFLFTFVFVYFSLTELDLGCLSGGNSIKNQHISLRNETLLQQHFWRLKRSPAALEQTQISQEIRNGCGYPLGVTVNEYTRCDSNWSERPTIHFFTFQFIIRCSHREIHRQIYTTSQQFGHNHSFFIITIYYYIMK